MKLSLQEIREENLSKPDAIDRSIVKVIPRFVPKIRPDRNGTCKKHGALHRHAARLGSQRTKSKRARSIGDRLSYPGLFLSNGDFKFLEESYQKARADFHKEPCTCGTTK